MLFKCDIYTDKSWKLHLPTTLENRSFGKQLVQESYSIFHHHPLCNVMSFSPHCFVQDLKYYCDDFKKAVQKTRPRCRQRVCSIYRGMGDCFLRKWSEEQFNILGLAHTNTCNGHWFTSKRFKTQLKSTFEIMRVEFFIDEAQPPHFEL